MTVAFSYHYNVSLKYTILYSPGDRETAAAAAACWTAVYKLYHRNSRRRRDWNEGKVHRLWATALDQGQHSWTLNFTFALCIFNHISLSSHHTKFLCKLLPSFYTEIIRSLRSSF